jgi:alpha-aminoadipate carrier protein LysW
LLKTVIFYIFAILNKSDGVRPSDTRRISLEEKMTECPICGAEVQKNDDTVVGELIECPECGSELEVTGIAPFTVDEAPQEEEDWGQ